MRQIILELWTLPAAEPGGLWRSTARDRVFLPLERRLKALQASTARGIDDWIGALDDSHTRPDRDF